MEKVNVYPRECRRSIRVITELTNAGPETAYAMLLMTALLMDMRPESGDVLRMVLEDCGIEEEKKDEIA